MNDNSIPYTYENPILAIGIGSEAVGAINCMFDEKLEYVDYLLIHRENTIDSSPINNQIIIGNETVTGVHNTQLEESEIIKINNEIEKLSKFIHFIVVGFNDCIDNCILDLVLSKESSYVGLRILVVLIPEKSKLIENIHSDSDVFNKLKSEVDLLIPISGAFQSDIEALNTSSLTMKADYLAMLTLETIIDFSHGNLKNNIINTRLKDIYEACTNKGLGFFAVGESTGLNKCIDAFDNAMKANENNRLYFSNAEKIILYFVFDFDYDNSVILLSEITKFFNYIDELAPVGNITWNYGRSNIREKLRITIIGTGINEISTLI